MREEAGAVKRKLAALVVGLILVAGSGMVLARGWGETGTGKVGGLGLTEEQRAAIASVREQRAARVAELRGGMGKVRHARKPWVTGLTEEQRAAIASIREQYAPRLAELRQAMREARQAKEWETFGALAAEVARLTDEMRTAIQAVLTPEQLEQLKGVHGERGEWGMWQKGRKQVE